MGRSQWQRGLSRSSAAPRLLGLRVRIRGAWVSLVIVVFCQVEVSATADHSCRGFLPRARARVCVLEIRSLVHRSPNC
jgi:hypothetical protein